MAFRLYDRLTIDDAAKIRYTQDGYLVAMPRVARTGIQLYRGSELGRMGDDAKKIFRVYRPESEVFHTDSMASYAHKPVTDDHPPEAVNADNWFKYGKGQMGDEVARDGQAIRVPMVLMDGGLIKKFQAGKAELSQGYDCDIVWTSGTSPEGELYDCSMANIRSNHTAVVDAARAGPDYRIGDGTGDARVNMSALAAAMSLILKGNICKDGLADASEGHLAKDAYPILKAGSVSIGSLRAAKTNAIAKGDGDIQAAVDNLLALLPQEPAAPAIQQKDTRAMKTLVIDGITVEVGDGNATEVIQKHIRELSDKLTAAQGQVAAATTTHAAAITAKDGEIAKLTTDLAGATAKVTTLEQQVKDAALTPQKLDALVADRAVVAVKAKVAMGDKASTLIVDGKTDDEIRKQVVDAKLGDLAKGWTPEQIKISFDSLTAGIDPAKVTTQDAATSGYRPGGIADTARAFSVPMSDAAEAAAQKRDNRLEAAWKTPAPTAQQ